MMGYARRSTMSGHIRKHRRKSRWKKIVSFLGCLVVFCTIYALILPAITLEKTTYCDTEEHTHTDICYNGEQELICRKKEHVHTDECYAEPSTEGGGSSNTVEHADSDDSVQSVAYQYEDDSLAVKAELPVDSQIPADVQLRVTVITEEDDTYSELTEKAQQAISGQTEQIALYDVSFYVNGENGEEYLPVSDTATVSFQFKEKVMDDGSGDIAVLHYNTDQEIPVELDSVEVQRDENQSLSELTFETEGFSVFAVVKVVDEEIEDVSSTDVTELSGEYYIARTNNNIYYAMTSEEGTKTIDGAARIGRIVSGAITSVSGLADTTAWTFEQAEANTANYYISALVTDGEGSEVREYLSASKISNTTSTLEMVESKENAAIFTVSKSGKNILISCTVDGNTYYINPHGGVPNATVFLGWYENTGGSLLNLYAKNATTKDNLDGKSFAIVNRAQGNYALTAELFPDNNWTLRVPGLAAKEVNVITQGDQTYVIGADIPLWEFHAVEGKTGVYTVSTDVDGEIKYLRYLETHYLNSESETRGSLTLTGSLADATEITVTKHDSGRVLLGIADTASWMNRAGEGTGFWIANNNGSNSQMYLCEKLTDDEGLVYNLALPESNNWINQPAIEDTFQSVGTEGTTLFSVENGNEVGSFVYNSLSAGARTDVVTYYNNYNNALKTAGTLTAENYRAPGREYRFEGWQATVDGVTYTFPEGAAAVWQNDGIHITDEDGTEQVLQAGTTLTGKWTMVSDVVLFFVNFGDTMLEEEDQQPIIDYNPAYYTADVVIGHIYNPTSIVPDKNSDGKDVIEKEHDSIIQAEFASSYDLTNSGTQIVIDAVRVFPENPTNANQAIYTEASGINQSAVETKVGDYIRVNPDSSKQIKIENVTVDQDKITSDNYKLYWYLQKNVSGDGWHIDGVLVARTQEMVVYKTFSGLDQDQVNSLMMADNPFQFQLGLIQNDGSQEYIRMTTESQSGVYSYDGQQGTNQQIYKWTLNAIQQQEYTFTEQNYELDGYDCSELISVHYTDGSLEVKNNTDTTWDWNDNKDVFGKPIKGGSAVSVIFANFYTPTGTGVLSVCKLAEDDTGKLEGAVFTLTKEGETDPIYTKTTNSNGSAYFSNLEAGTYILEETEAPDGYVKSDHTWTVEVKVEDSVATVELYENDISGNKTGEGTVVYETGKGVTNYEISNHPETSTLTITKHFTGLDAASMAAIYNASKSTENNGYCIKVTGKFGTDTTETTRTLYLDGATQVTGEMGYRWTLTGLQERESYIIVEENYIYSNYLDTVVQGKLTTTPPDTAANTSDEVPVLTDQLTDAVKNADNTEAKFRIQKTGNADSVDITNTYTNTFHFVLMKTDSETDVPLGGATFDIYGEYADSTDTSNTITYTDPDTKNTVTAWYIGTTTESASDTGYAKSPPLKLSSETKTFVYVLKEFKGPDGYVVLDEPIVQAVRVGSDGYYNGIYQLSVPNTRKENAVATVTATKVWAGQTLSGYPEITLNLYRAEGEEKAGELLGSVSLNGTAEGESSITVDGKTVTVAYTGWTVTWSGLPAYKDKDTIYNYYISETPMDGFTTSYSTDAESLKVDGDNIQAALADGTETTRSVTVTNTAGYELPKTGGTGTLRFTIGGMLLTAGCLLYGCNLRRRRERRFQK